MKTLAKAFLLFTTITLFAFSCDDDPEISVASNTNDVIVAYAKSGAWTEDRMMEELEGDWSWKRSLCSNFGQFENNTTRYADFYIRIQAGGTLQVFEGSQLVHTMTWELNDSGRFTDTKPACPVYLFSAQMPEQNVPLTFDLSGCVYIANGILVFSLIPVDGCDTFFQKK